MHLLRTHLLEEVLHAHLVYVHIIFNVWKEHGEVLGTQIIITFYPKKIVRHNVVVAEKEKSFYLVLSALNLKSKMNLVIRKG